MARKTKKGKRALLYKAACGLMLICFTVFVCGQAIHGVSAKTILFKSSALLIVIGLSMHVVVKLWSSWEDIKD
jgi:uncharacterized membrane protein